jgi:hypothetical protein
MLPIWECHEDMAGEIVWAWEGSMKAKTQLTGFGLGTRGMDIN